MFAPNPASFSNPSPRSCTEVVALDNFVPLLTFVHMHDHMHAI
jgi:hypothetical protein